MGSSWTDSLNFPLILVLATFVTGVIWLLDAVLFAPKRARRAQATAVAAGPSTAPALRSRRNTVAILLPPWTSPPGRKITTSMKSRPSVRCQPLPMNG